MMIDVKHLLVRYIVVLALFNVIVAYAWSGWYMRHHARDLCWAMVDCKKL